MVSVEFLEGYKDLAMAPNYQISYGVVDSHILLIQGRGDMGAFNAERHYDTVEELIDRGFLKTPIAEIRDYTFLKGIPKSIEVARQKERIVALGVKFAVLCACNAPWVIRSILHLAVLRFREEKTQMILANDLEHAVTKCKEVLEQTKVESSALGNRLYRRVQYSAGWSFENPTTGFKVECGSIPGLLMLTRYFGENTLESLAGTLDVVEKLSREGGLEDRRFISIVDVTQQKKYPSSVRRAFAKGYSQVMDKHQMRPSCTYLVGMRALDRAALKLYSRVLDQKFVFKETLLQAFEEIELGQEEMNSTHVSKEQIDEVASLCGDLLWDEKTLGEDVPLPVSRKNPLYDLARSLWILRADWIHLQKLEKEKMEEERCARERETEMADQLRRKSIELEKKVKELELAQVELRDLAQRAEAANRAKGEFLANMSHEIRTPMNGVVGMLSLLSDTALDHTQQHYISCAKNSSESMLTIINDILDFSKIEAGKLEIEQVPFDLWRLLEELAEFFRMRAGVKKIRFQLRRSDALPKRVLGDPGRLRQVLTNLVGNAIKFTEQGEVCLACYVISERENLCHLKFDVKDTGIGIERDKLTHLFDRFTQEDASTTRRFGGTGLGLSISRRLSEMMGGFIAVQSTKGVGSLFAVNLLLRVDLDGSAETESVEEVGFEDLRSKRVLVVDDNVINLKVAVGLLKKIGVVADKAHNGIEAIQALQEFDFDLVFMDCQMPEMDGYEATRKIREEKSGVLNPRVFVVAMTANAMKGDREKCLAAGMDHYISKPIHKKDLIHSFVLSLGKSPS